MWNVVFKGVWAYKLRFISTAIAIVLGVGFMAGTFVFTDSIKRTFDDLFASVYNGTDTVVRSQKLVEQDGGEGERRDRIDGSYLERVRAVPGVANAEPYVRGYAQLIKRNNKPLGGRAAPTFGIGWIADPALNPFNIIDGRPPAGPNEIAIDKASSKNGSFAVGDDVRVLSQSATATYRIVGVMRFGTADSPGAATAIAFTVDHAKAVFETKDRIDGVFARATSGVSQTKLRDAVASVVTDDRLEVLTGTEVTKQTQNNLKKRLNGFTQFLNAFAYLALFVGMFVISNTFSILVAQRTRELAMLRAIGAGRRQILFSVVAEAFVIGVVGAAIGVAAGLGLAVGLKAVFATLGFTLPGASLVLLPRTVIVSIIAGVVVTVVSAILPAWRASRVLPLAAIRDVSVDRSASSRWRLGIGLFIAVADVIVVVRGLAQKAELTVGAGFAIAVIAITVLGPTIARPIGFALGAPLPTMAGMPGQLARSNSVRNPRRTARTALALTIGISVVAMVLTFVSSFKGLLDRTINGEFSADYILTNRSFTGFSPEVARTVASVDGVDVVTGVRFGNVKINGDDEFIAAVDTKIAGRLVNFPVTSGKVTDIGPGDIAVSDKAARKNGWTLGQSIDVVLPNGKTTLRIKALFDDVKIRAILQGGSSIIDLSTYDANFPDSLDFQVYVKATKDADLDQLGSALDVALKDYPTAEVLDQAEYKRSVSDQLNQFVGIIFVLLGLSVLIAVFGVANTLLLSIHERQREIGLLRAVGMTQRQTRTTVLLESIIIAVLGVVLGLALGVGFGVLIMKSLSDNGFTQIVVPIGSLVTATLIGVVFGVVAGIRPARKAARLDILAAIGTE